MIPMHPRTQKYLEKYNIALSEKIICLPPVGYMEMLYLLKHCKLVLSDSGGLQKEAFFFKKYCLTLRDETEWVELIENGFNTLVGADYNLIMESYTTKKDLELDFSMDLYGKGMLVKKYWKV